MELFGRGLIVLCLSLFATPARSARIKVDLFLDNLTGAAAPLAASTALPNSSSKDAQVGKETSTDTSDAVLVLNNASKASKDDAINWLVDEESAEKQDEHTVKQAGAHPGSQVEFEPELSSTVIQDGKAAMRTTRCLNAKCETENTQGAFGKDLGKSDSDVKQGSQEVSTVAADTVLARKGGSTTTTRVSDDGAMKSKSAEGAAEKHDEQNFTQAGVQPHMKSKPDESSTVVQDGKASPTHRLRSKPFMVLEVVSIFTFMGFLSYAFSLCL